MTLTLCGEIRLLLVCCSSFSSGSSRLRLLLLDVPPDESVWAEEELEGEEEDELAADFDDCSTD